MKVLHLSSERSWRGGEQQIAYLMEELEKKGVESVVACRKGSAFEAYCYKQDIACVPLAFANEFDLFTAWQIRNFCKEMNVDIVHMHSGHSHAIGVWSSILGNKARLILSRRVDFPIKNNVFSRFKYNYKKIERIVCVSQAIEKITRQGLKNPDVCTTVYSGIDLSKFREKERQLKLHSEYNIHPDQKIIANISAIAPHKDYFTFVNTIEVLVNSGLKAKYLIIGDGPERQEIEQYVRSKSLEKDIIFTGFRSDIPDLIKELDLMLITSKTEGLGTTILDAFANRIPVVATRAGGIPEAVIHRETGLLAEVGNHHELAKWVIEIFKEEELRTKIIKGAWDRLLFHFTKEKMTDGMLKVYRRLV